MLRPCTRFLLSIIAAGLLVTSVNAEKIEIVTTNFPPYSFQRNGNMTGMATEIVEATFKTAGLSHQKIQSFPWARAYHNALYGKNTLIYSIARSAEREPLFQWIGKIAPYRIHLYKLKSRKNVKVSSLEDAKHYIVGGEFADIKQAYLIKQGFVEDKNLQLASSDEINIRMLFAGRIDLLPFDDFSLPIMLNREGHSLAELEPVVFLKDISYDLYLAANKSISPEITGKLRQALESIKKSGQLSKIHSKYLETQLARIE